MIYSKIIDVKFQRKTQILNEIFNVNIFNISEKKLDEIKIYLNFRKPCKNFEDLISLKELG